MARERRKEPGREGGREGGRERERNRGRKGKRGDRVRVDVLQWEEKQARLREEPNSVGQVLPEDYLANCSGMYTTTTVKTQTLPKASQK